MKYEVLSPVEHNGTPYEEGSQVSMTEDCAAALVAAGVLRVLEAAAGDGRKTRSGEG